MEWATIIGAIDQYILERIPELRCWPHKTPELGGNNTIIYNHPRAEYTTDPYIAIEIIDDRLIVWACIDTLRQKTETECANPMSFEKIEQAIKNFIMMLKLNSKWGVL